MATTAALLSAPGLFAEAIDIAVGTNQSLKAAIVSRRLQHVRMAVYNIEAARPIPLIIHHHHLLLGLGDRPLSLHPRVSSTSQMKLIADLSHSISFEIAVGLFSPHTHRANEEARSFRFKLCSVFFQFTLVGLCVPRSQIPNNIMPALLLLLGLILQLLL